MIPPVREFLSACEFLARRFGWDLSPHDDDLIEALVEARLEAERLALGSGDEVAALFYACSASSAWLGEDYVTLVIVITLNHAMALGRKPVGDRRRVVRELSRWAHEIAGGIAGFEACRAWLAEHVPAQEGSG
jgi:hypothetical protein